MSVSIRFTRFISALELTDEQKAQGGERRERVVSTLNLHYRSSVHSTANSRYVGSWGKRTRMRPPRDVDVVYELPNEVYWRYEARQGNKQSHLLQEVKGILQSAFPRTDIRGDGPVVVVPFSSYCVELIPAFRNTEGKYLVCDTRSGGRYIIADYIAEAEAITQSNRLSADKTRHLIKMMKRWQSHCSVPLKSFQIELLAIEFISSWKHRNESISYYDFMIRDFLEYLVSRENAYVFAPGTFEPVPLGQAWVSRAITAWRRAERACTHEMAGRTEDAGDEWQKIFGTDIPKHV